MASDACLPPLAGIIERSCVDGQKTYHTDLSKAAQEEISANKEKYADPGVTSTSSAPAQTDSTEESSSSTEQPTLLDQLTTPSPFLFLTIAAVILLLTNFWTLIALRHQARAAHEARLGHPGEVASAVGRVLADFKAVHEKRGGGAKHHGEVEALVRMVKGLEGGLREVTDRLEGLRRGV